VFDFLRNWLGSNWSGRTERDAAGSNGLQDDADGMAQEYRRFSSGLDQFLAGFHEIDQGQMLDVGAGSSATINYLGEGHRFETSDLLHALESICGPSGQCNSDQFQDFLERACDFRVVDFDGALVWEVLQFMPPAVRVEVVRRLHRTLRPNSYLFAMFYTGDWGGAEPPAMTHHILGQRELASIPRRIRLKPYPITIREVDVLFSEFGSVKYVLSRGSLREVIVRR
jgi:hypothetical protein